MLESMNLCEIMIYNVIKIAAALIYLCKTLDLWCGISQSHFASQ